MSLLERLVILLCDDVTLLIMIATHRAHLRGALVIAADTRYLVVDILHWTPNPDDLFHEDVLRCRVSSLNRLIEAVTPVTWLAFQSRHIGHSFYFSHPPFMVSILHLTRAKSHVLVPCWNWRSERRLGVEHLVALFDGDVSVEGWTFWLLRERLLSIDLIVVIRLKSKCVELHFWFYNGV